MSLWKIGCEKSKIKNRPKKERDFQPCYLLVSTLQGNRKEALVNETFQTFKSLVSLDDNKPQLIDTIWHDGTWWLVATWLEHLATRHRIPERIIQMDGTAIRFQDFQEFPDQRYRFRLTNSIPKSVFYGAPQSGYVIASHPAAVAHNSGPGAIH